MLVLTWLLLAIVGWSSGDVTDGTTLLSTFLVHRHGDRTPTDSSISLCTDYKATFEATLPYGYGQLTDVGKRRSYALGQSIRRRYNGLLSPYYNRSEIYIRSTDSTRTKMTALVAMSAVYPAYPGSWSETINWVPVPYTTVPVKYDFIQAMLNCPKFERTFRTAMLSNPSRMDAYSSVMEVIGDVMGSSSIAKFPILSYAFYDAYVSQESLGVPLDERIKAIMPELMKTAGEAIDVLFGNEDNIRLQSGVLLNEFFIYANKTINGEDTPRVRIYSAHDATVYPFTAISQIYPRQGVPKYASNFALELRKVDATGEYVVLAVYESSPGEPLLHLPIKGCNSLLCNIDTFRSIVSKYILDEDSWRTECGWSNSLEINDSDVA